MSENTKFHSGFITIVGRPNVGKSTLMNAMVGEKIAIVSSRPQTTRNRIMGVATDKGRQIVFLDTPGLHKPRTRLGEYMVKSVQDAMDGIDVLLVLVDANEIGPQDRAIVEEMSARKVKKILVLNKTDIVEEARLMAAIQSFAEAGYDAIVPTDARTGKGMDELKKLIVSYLPDKMYLGSWMRVSDLLTYYSDFFEDFDMSRANAMLESLKISPKDRLKTMSKGTKEKVQLILTMSRRAKLYCLDEPIAGVDPAARDYILSTILNNYEPDASILISTHLISDVENILDEVIFIQEGQLKLHASVEDIRMQEGESIDSYFREVFKC